MSTKFHDPLVIDEINGNVPTKETGSTGATGTTIGSNGFVSGGLKGGTNPVVKKSSGILELLVVETYSV